MWTNPGFEKYITLKSHNTFVTANLQIWNHDFLWESIKPGGGGKPTGELLELIERDFDSFEKFLEEFKSAAATQFGSGWAWLACESNYLVYFPSYLYLYQSILLSWVTFPLFR